MGDYRPIMEVENVHIAGLPLDVVGFLFVVLQWHWNSQVYPPDDPEELSKLLGSRHRKKTVCRLWSKEAKQLFRRMRRPAPISKECRKRVWNKTEGVCFHCGVALTEQKHKPNSYHVDHHVAVRSGGTSHIDNLVPACRTCNISKGGYAAVPLTTGRDYIADHGDLVGVRDAT